MKLLILLMVSLMMFRPFNSQASPALAGRREAVRTAMIRFLPQHVAAGDPYILTYYPFYFIGREDLDAAPVSATMQGTAFVFRVPADHPVYISLGLKNGAAPVVRLFLVQAGTAVTIRETEAGVRYSGKDAALFQCQAALQEIRWKQPVTGAENDYWTARPYEDMARKKRISDSFYTKKVVLLEQYKKSIGAVPYRILKADCRGLAYYNLYGDLRFSLDMAQEDRTRQQELIRFYNDSLRQTKVESFIPEAVYSRTLADGLLEKGRVDVRVKENDFRSWERTVPTTALYNLLDNNYKGPLLEKLLVLVLDRLSGSPEEVRLLQGTEERLQEPYFQSLLQAYLQRLPGAPAYPFLLEDRTGNRIRLDDFKGKTVVMKFWMTGCSFCESLEEQMKAVRKEFEGDSSVAFMDVCVDEKDVWEKGLATGLYAAPDAFNVYLSGQGTNHPLLKQYGYIGFPALLIIDPNGRVVSSRPDRPFGAEKTAAFLSLIRNGW